MVSLELSNQEAETLAMLLKSDLSDLRMEIAGTENKEWRDDLKAREEFLNVLIGRLNSAAA